MIKKTLFVLLLSGATFSVSIAATDTVVPDGVTPVISHDIAPGISGPKRTELEEAIIHEAELQARHDAARSMMERTSLPREKVEEYSGLTIRPDDYSYIKYAANRRATPVATTSPVSATPADIAPLTPWQQIFFRIQNPMYWRTNFTKELFECIQSADKEGVRKWIHLGADVKKMWVDGWKRDALDFAVRHGTPEILSLLINARRPDPFIYHKRDNQGEILLGGDLIRDAARKEFPEFLNVLLAAGANDVHYYESGNSPHTTPMC